MEEPRPILYGVSDYAQIRKKNAWFVDRTAKIRDLEKVAYALFLRPRRFGKSLWLAILEAYYDIDCAGRVEELFAGTDIGTEPAPERNAHLVLYFNFSAVKKTPSEVQASFESYTADRFDAFARKYAKRMPAGLADEILSRNSAGEKMSSLFGGMKGHEPGICCLIDEYDNFTNTILAESGLKAYNDLCHGDGFFKQFFGELKTLTTSLDAPLKRLFITGVSPVTMDDVTSGFNIGTNISMRSQFADLTGFRHDDLRAMIDYYAPLCSFDAQKAMDVCLEWFDQYHFGSFDAPPVANTTLVLNFFEQLVNAQAWPKDYVDKNLRTDYAKIRHLLEVDKLVEPEKGGFNGNFGVLEKLVGNGTLSEPLVDSFQAQEIAIKENFVSLLYWMGITTIVDDDMGTPVFGVPNGALRSILARLFTQSYSEGLGIDQRLPAVNAGMRRFAKTGEWDGILEPLLAVVKQNFAIRDAKEGETAVASAVSAILISAGGPYVITREREANSGFYDLAMEPRFDIAPQIAHAGLIELKYLKPGDPEPTPESLAAIKAEAIDQLDKYSADPALAAKWRLKECPQLANGNCSQILNVHKSSLDTNVNANGVASNPGEPETVQPFNFSTFQPFNLSTDGAAGSVSLHRLVLVFRGGDCILSEEV